MSTAIEWTEKVWNPVIGCSMVSAGCQNCYAMRMAARLASNPKTPQYRGVAEFGPAGPRWLSVKCLPGRLGAPLKWRKPRMVFVNSMSDLFHEDVPDSFICRAWNIMRQCQQHTFQVLTKRPERMASIVPRLRFDNRGDGHVYLAQNASDPEGGWSLATGHLGCSGLKNVWLGVSVEDQGAADERIPYLLRTPAAVRFVSCEPLLGPVMFARGCDYNWLDPVRTSASAPDPVSVDWVIVGGETGPGARSLNLDWAYQIMNKCVYSGVPFFFKGWGTHGPEHFHKKSDSFYRVLDGREWNEMPEARR